MTLALRGVYFIQKIIEASLLFAFIVTPLAFGSVHILAFTGLQTLVLFIFLLYGIR